MQIRVLLCACVLLAGCATRATDPNAPRELLPDPTFAQWFNIRGLGQPDDDDGVKGVFRSSAAKACKPEWTLAQWASKHSLADPDLHAAQFQLFLYVQNLTPGDDGFGDMLWFGIPVFDSRRPLKKESYQRDAGKPDASGKFIYSLSSKDCLPQGQAFFKEGRIVAGKDARWTSIRINAAPWIVYAFKLARKNGYLPDTELKDLYVSGLNFGWEMPGTYDAAMQVRGFSLLATPLPTAPAPPVLPQPAAAREDARPPKSIPDC